jgi:alkaline phosphatase
MQTGDESCVRLGRRAFLQQGTLLLTSAVALDGSLLLADDATKLSVGLITDLHYADKAPAGTRYYRETQRKLSEAGEHFQKSKVDFIVELGDLIDAADSVDTEQRYLNTINRDFASIAKDRHYVLGNHCVDTLTKDEFLGGVEQAKSYYSFERGGIHFVILDACFRSDGQPYGRKNSKWNDANIPAAELEWLTSDLQANDKPVIVFAHQRLDVSNDHGVKNCVAVRRILEASGKVLAVFQGHSHQNDLKDINGIHYATLVAMVEGSGIENNGYSLLDITSTGTLRVQGFRKQKTYDWAAKS